MPRNAPQRHTRREIARHGAGRRPPHGGAAPIEGARPPAGKNRRARALPRFDRVIMEREGQFATPRDRGPLARGLRALPPPRRARSAGAREKVGGRWPIDKNRLCTSNQPIVRRSCEFSCRPTAVKFFDDERSCPREPRSCECHNCELSLLAAANVCAEEKPRPRPGNFPANTAVSPAGSRRWLATGQLTVVGVVGSRAEVRSERTAPSTPP